MTSLVNHIRRQRLNQDQLSHRAERLLALMPTIEAARTAEAILELDYPTPDSTDVNICMEPGEILDLLQPSTLLRVEDALGQVRLLGLGHRGLVFGGEVGFLVPMTPAKVLSKLSQLTKPFKAVAR